jgi:hypothetical protein
MVATISRKQKARFVEFLLKKVFLIKTEKLIDETICNIANSADEIERKYIGKNEF